MWSYDGDPTGDRKDEVRLMVGDTNEADPLVTDEEINYILDQYPPADGKAAWMAAAAVCDTIAGQFGRKADRSVGPLSISASQQWEHYKDLANNFRVLAATNGKGLVQGSMASVIPAAPVLGGGGKTYLGSSTYMNPEGNF